MKLWVDDIRKAPDETWHTARSITEAIRVLALFDSASEISLDYDIGNYEETFEPVARYIALRWSVERFPGASVVPYVTIHSQNPVGAQRMKDILHPHVNVSVKAYSA